PFSCVLYASPRYVHAFPTRRSSDLAWKLAAVLKGQAGDDLLNTYSTERAPVAKQIVTRANQSGREFMQLIDALGITDDMSPEQIDRKSTRLNSSHVSISYAVFCLKK